MTANHFVEIYMYFMLGIHFDYIKELSTSNTSHLIEIMQGYRDQKFVGIAQNISSEIQNAQKNIF